MSEYWWGQRCSGDCWAVGLMMREMLGTRPWLEAGLPNTCWRAAYNHQPQDSLCLLSDFSLLGPWDQRGLGVLSCLLQQ